MRVLGHNQIVGSSAVEPENNRQISDQVLTTEDFFYILDDVVVVDRTIEGEQEGSSRCSSSDGRADIGIRSDRPDLDRSRINSLDYRALEIRLACRRALSYSQSGDDEKEDGK